ncbi:hypothetical protein HDU98_010769 [Podochytrium sp. JEL0797]|nr:hypothetical protein HDU98_010769 [Podochytrium sp. JEL0797]
MSAGPQPTCKLCRSGLNREDLMRTCEGPLESTTRPQLFRWKSPDWRRKKDVRSEAVPKAAVKRLGENEGIRPILETQEMVQEERSQRGNRFTRKHWHKLMKGSTSVGSGNVEVEGSSEFCEKRRLLVQKTE